MMQGKNWILIQNQLMGLMRILIRYAFISLNEINSHFYFQHLVEQILYIQEDIDVDIINESKSNRSSLG